MFVAIVLVLGIVLLSSPHQAQAKKIKYSTKYCRWILDAPGTSVDIATLAESAPTWLQLLSNEGIKMTSGWQDLPSPARWTVRLVRPDHAIQRRQVG